MKYIFLDLDGTITDPREGITKSIQYALEAFGIKVENLNELTKYIGPPLKDTFMCHYFMDENETTRAIAKYRERFEEIGWLENHVYEGMEEALSKLKDADMKLVVATSKPESMAVRILEHFGLAKYFTDICGATMDGSRSSKVDVITYAMEKNHITNKNNILMVGDRNYDIIGAKGAGIKSMGVLYGFGSIEEFEQEKADFVAATVSEMCEKCLKF